MPLKNGYSHAVFEQNYKMLRLEKVSRENALAAAYDHARKSFFARHPHGALPMWLAYPDGTRTCKTCGGRKKNPVPESSRSTKHSREARIEAAGGLFSRFTGHDADELVSIDKPEFPDVLSVIGDIDGVLYTTVRDGETEKYIHKFKKNCRPLFCVTHDGKQIFMLGGSYDFTERGIVDRTKS